MVEEEDIMTTAIQLKTENAVKALQSALLARGFDPKGVDGDIGRNTIAAVKAFQRANGLKVDGIPGEKTLTALGLVDGGPRAVDLTVVTGLAAEPVWVMEARKYMGLHEVRDAKVLDALLDLDASEIPWCGAFTGMVIGKVLPDENLPSNMLWARNWEKLGTGLNKSTVVLGAIAVFARGTGGHVGIVVGHDETTLHVLGGNQSNSVSITRVAKDRLLDLRWPSTGGPIGAVLPMTKLAATISRNEA